MRLPLPNLAAVGAKGSPLGLTVDASGVVLAELNDKGTSVRAVADVALPAGAVSAGEILQPEVVGQAIGQLLVSSGVRGRKVDFAISSPRVALRLLEVPEMPESELQTSLAFQVGDILPIPAEEMVVDYQSVGYLEGADGKRTRQILVVASNREQVRGYLTAAKVAGLSVRKIDSAPLALARCLRDLLAPYDATTGSAPVEGIVHVGPDVTDVVVTAGGTTMFGRSLGAGADAGALATDEANQLADRLFPLMEDIRNTLAFAISQVARERLSRVLLVTNPSLEQVLVDCLQATLGVPVQPVWVAHVAGVRDVAGADTVDGTFAVPFALAVNRLTPSTEHTPSLLPSEIQVEARKRRRVALAAAGGVAAAGLLVAATVNRFGDVSNAEARSEAAAKAQARETARLSALQDVQHGIDLANSRKAALVGQFTGTLDYLNLINDVSDHLPADVRIDSIALAKATTLTLSMEGGTPDAAARTIESFATSTRLGDPWVSSVTWTTSPVDPATGSPIPGAPPGVATFVLELNILPAAVSGRASEFEVTK